MKPKLTAPNENHNSDFLRIWDATVLDLRCLGCGFKFLILGSQKPGVGVKSKQYQRSYYIMPILPYGENELLLEALSKMELYVLIWGFQYILLNSEYSTPLFS